MSDGRIRVAVVAGGRSSEHEISLASARSVLEALDPERYEVVNVAIGRDGRWELESGAEPAELPQATIELVQRRSVESFVASECEGMARVDFFVRDDGEVVLNELNTIPGFTATSFYARLFAASGIAYEELLRRLIDLALERHERRKKLQY